MTDLETFQSPDGRPLRSIVRDGVPWFVAADVCAALGLVNLHSSLALLDEDEKGLHTVDTPGGQQAMTAVTEAGLYSLILRSRKAEAKTFKRWVTHDVLPAIRRTGVYGVPAAPAPDLTTPSGVLALAEAYMASARELVAANEQLAIAAPKAAQADYHRAADGLIPVGDFANKVKAWAKDTHGIRVLHTEVWDYLGQIGLLIRGNTRRNNQPTAFAIERDFVRAKETEYEAHGEVRVSTSPRLTPAGEGWAWDRIVGRLLGHGSLRPSTDIERKAS